MRQMVLRLVIDEDKAGSVLLDLAEHKITDRLVSCVWETAEKVPYNKNKKRRKGGPLPPDGPKKGDKAGLIVNLLGMFDELTYDEIKAKLKEQNVSGIGIAGVVKKLVRQGLVTRLKGKSFKLATQE